MIHTASPYIFPGITTGTVTIDKILNRVCKMEGLTVKEIRTKTRKKEIVFARQVATYIIRMLLPEVKIYRIASLFRYADHSTICYNTDTVRDMMKTYPDIKEKVDKLIMQCRY